jgi:histidinol dehydrogenase
MKELIPLIRVKRRDAVRVASQIRRRADDLLPAEKRVSDIVADVRKNGDAALFRYSQEFEGVDLRGAGLAIPADEIKEAGQRVDGALLDAMRFSLRRIRRTQGQLLERLSFSYVSEGYVIRTAPKPIPSVGCYIPGGRAAYASTVLMTAGVAKLAGVKRVVLCTPPGKDGKVKDAILAAASVCGVDEVYRVGGAQSIAALAYGTKTVKRVSKIVGPGGFYVSVAKRLVSAETMIDFFAGPTELIVVGDSTTDPRLAAWDLVGQAEHGGDSICGLVTWDSKLASRVRSEVARIVPKVERREFVEACLARGFTALCPDGETAAELLNALAPEHLQLMIKSARDYAPLIENAGLILSGEYAPCAASDYCIGTDHVIPTEGYAKVRTGLSALDFVKLNWVVEGTRRGLRSLLPSLKELALAEGLPNHYRSVESRFRK